MSGAAPESPFDDRAGALAYLRSLAALGEVPWPIGEAALALAALDRPQVALARYREHLRALATDVGAAALGTDETEDRARGWEMTGLAFPGHFLLRLEGRGGSSILDPFHEGSIKNTAELRTLLKSVAGADRELAAADYAAAPDREVLLRLQNNIKLRLLESGRREAALAIIESMLAMAPDRAELWREQGTVNASICNLGAAIRSLEAAMERERDSTRRFATAALLQDLKTRLQ